MRAHPADCTHLYCAGARERNMGTWWETLCDICALSHHNQQKKLDCEISGGIIRKQGSKLSPALCTGRKWLFSGKRIVANVNLKWCDAGITTLPKSFQMCLKALSVFNVLIRRVCVNLSPLCLNETVDKICNNKNKVHSLSCKQAAHTVFHYYIVCRLHSIYSDIIKFTASCIQVVVAYCSVILKNVWNISTPPPSSPPGHNWLNLSISPKSPKSAVICRS